MIADFIIGYVVASTAASAKDSKLRSELDTYKHTFSTLKLAIESKYVHDANLTRYRVETSGLRMLIH